MFPDRPTESKPPGSHVSLQCADEQVGAGPRFSSPRKSEVNIWFSESFGFGGNE